MSKIYSKNLSNTPEMSGGGFGSKFKKKIGGIGKQLKAGYNAQKEAGGDPIGDIFNSLGPKTDEEKGFTPPGKVTEGTGSNALIASLRAKRAKNPVEMYLNSTKKKQQEETTFG